MSLMSISRFARLATPHLKPTPRTCPISVKTAQYFESLRTQPVLKRSFSAKPENDNIFVSKKVLLNMRGINLSDFPDLKDDFEAVLSIVKNNGCQLKHASDRLKNDPTIVMAAVKNNGCALKHASPELQNNDAIFCAKPENDNISIVKNALLKIREINLDDFPYLQDDFETVLSVVKNDGYQLKHASDRLKNDPAIVMAAVSNNGYALKYASHKLQNNDEIVLKAVSKSGFAIQFADDDKKNDVKFAKIAVTECGMYVMRYLLPDVQDELWDYAVEISDKKRRG